MRSARLLCAGTKEAVEFGAIYPVTEGAFGIAERARQFTSFHIGSLFFASGISEFRKYSGNSEIRKLKQNFLFLDTQSILSIYTSKGRHKMARKSKVEVQAGQGAVVTNRKVKKLSQQRVRRVSRGAIQHIRVDSDVLTSTMVSTDFGNGYGEAWRLNEEGVIESYAMPHGRIPVTGDMLDANVMANQHDVEWFEWLGADAFVNGEQADDPQRYGYGEGVWDITERAPDQHRNDADRYAGDQQMSQIVLGAA